MLSISMTYYLFQNLLKNRLNAALAGQGLNCPHRPTFLAGQGLIDL